MLNRNCYIYSIHTTTTTLQHETMTEDEPPNQTPSLMVTKVDPTNYISLTSTPMEIEDNEDVCIVREAPLQDDDVFRKRMYSSTNDVLLRTPSCASIKRPAEFSPGLPRKRLSTSSNDIANAEIVENKLTKNMKQQRNSLNLSLPVGNDIVDRATCPQHMHHQQQHSRPNRLNISLPVNPAKAFSTTQADRFSLYRSTSTKSFRNKKNLRMMRSLATTPTTPSSFNNSPITPTLMNGLMTPKIKRTLTLSARHTASLSRTYSVRTPTRPVVLRRLNSETNGSISHFHSSQLNRTNSGFFKRRALSTCTLAQTPTLRRNGSCRIVSSKVKRCQSTRVRLINFFMIDSLGLN